MDVSLNSEIEKLVTRQIESGRFRSVDDVIQVAVRMLVDAEPTETHPFAKRSPRGLLSDIASYISPDDIQEARSEMWASMAQGES